MIAMQMVVIACLYLLVFSMFSLVCRTSGPIFGDRPSWAASILFGVAVASGVTLLFLGSVGPPR